MRPRQRTHTASSLGRKHGTYSQRWTARGEGLGGVRGDSILGAHATSYKQGPTGPAAGRKVPRHIAHLPQLRHHSALLRHLSVLIYGGRRAQGW